MRRDRHREAWTAFFDGCEAKPKPKYGNVREGKYASKRESYVATQLMALSSSGAISELREQVPFVLIPSNGKLRAVRYIADFTYRDNDGLHVIDVKGGNATKTPVYRLKKRLMWEVHKINIEEC